MPARTETGETRKQNQMRLFKTLVSPVGLLLLCSCGSSDTLPTAVEQTAPKPVVKYSRSKDVAVRKAVAEAALQPRGSSAVEPSLPARKDPAGGREKTPKELPENGGEKAAAGPPRPAASAPAKPAAVAAGADSVKPVEAARLLLKRLAGPPARAKKSYVDLWRVDKQQIPELIKQVASKEPTKLMSLDLLVLQDDFARYDEKEKRWYYWIKGMGNFEIDDIAMSKVSVRKGAARVRIKKFSGFPLGVVLRAGLLNRFRTSRFPGVDDRKYLSRWWKLFYRQNISSLK